MSGMDKKIIKRMQELAGIKNLNEAAEDTALAKFSSASGHDGSSRPRYDIGGIKTSQEFVVTWLKTVKMYIELSKDSGPLDREREALMIFSQHPEDYKKVPKCYCWFAIEGILEMMYPKESYKQFIENHSGEIKKIASYMLQILDNNFPDEQNEGDS